MFLEQSDEGTQQQAAREDDDRDDPDDLKAWLYDCPQCAVRFHKRIYFVLIASKTEACPKCGGKDMEILAGGDANLVVGWAHSLYLGLDDPFHGP